MNRSKLWALKLLKSPLLIWVGYFRLDLAWHLGLNVPNYICSLKLREGGKCNMYTPGDLAAMVSHHPPAHGVI